MKRLFAGIFLLCGALCSHAEETRPNANSLSGPTQTNLVIKPISAEEIQIGDVTLNKARRTLEFKAYVNMTEGLMEYFLVTTYGKVHESVLITETRPYAIHVGALLLSLKEVPSLKKPVPVELSLLWQKDGITNEVTAASCVLNLESKKEMTPGTWSYSGSQMIEGVFLSEREGSIISIIEDQAVLIQNPRKGKENDEIWQPNAKKLPQPDSMVTVRIKFPPLLKPDEKEKRK